MGRVLAVGDTVTVHGITGTIQQLQPTCCSPARYTATGVVVMTTRPCNRAPSRSSGKAERNLKRNGGGCCVGDGAGLVPFPNCASPAPLAHQRDQRTSSSAIWTALSAAPLRRLSLLRNSTNPLSVDEAGWSSIEVSWRIRPT